MKIITVLQQKGGVGKTTLALNIAAFFAQKGVAVAVCDADTQGSLTMAADVVSGLRLVSVPDVLAGRVPADIKLLVIDTSPRNDVDLPKLLAITDYALMPVRPGYFDVMAMRDTVAILQGLDQPCKAGIVLNQVQHRTAVTRDILELLGRFDIPVLMARVMQRVAYTRSPVTENAVFGSEDEQAIQEISQLGMEIHFNL